MERALTWFAKGREDLADADFDQAIRQTKNNPWLREFPFWVRANLRLENDRYADALADCEAIIGLNPAQSGGYALAAWILATCPDVSFRDGAKAVDYATKSIKLMRSGDKSDRNAILAAAYAETGRFNEAVRLQKVAIDSAPKAEKDRFRHALPLYESGMPYRDNAPSQPFRPKFGFDTFVQ